MRAVGKGKPRMVGEKISIPVPKMYTKREKGKRVGRKKEC